MAKPQSFTNPFYTLLLIAGLLFMITACAYAVMTVRGMEVSETVDTPAAQRFAQLVDEHGFTALMVELAVLAVATVGAIATDDYWARRAAEHAGEEAEE